MSKFKVGDTVRILRIDEVIIDGTHRAGMKALIVPEVFDGHIECQKMARYESVSRNKPIYYAQTSQGRWAMAEDTHHLPAYNFTTLRLCMPDGTHWRLA